jgi:HD superfamily phosphodiesterase
MYNNNGDIMKNFNLENIVNNNKVIIDISKKYMDTIVDDPEHDSHHINDVIENIVKIINNVDEEFDAEVCILAAYWHDVGRIKQCAGHEQVSAEMLSEEMLQLGYEEEKAQKCYDAIIYHKWTMSPQTIEGKIVKDADKLGWIGAGRWTSCLNNSYRLEEIGMVLPKLRNEILNFEYSKNLYDEQIVKLVSLLYARVK